MTASRANLLKQGKVTDNLQSNPVNTDIGSARINGVFVLSGLNLEKIKCKGLLSPGATQPVRNNEVSVLSGC